MALVLDPTFEPFAPPSQATAPSSTAAFSQFASGVDSGGGSFASPNLAGDLERGLREGRFRWAGAPGQSEIVRAPRGPVGPNGRTLDEIRGTDYLSADERAWFRAQETGRPHVVGPNGEPVEVTPEESIAIGRGLADLAKGTWFGVGETIGQAVRNTQREGLEQAQNIRAMQPEGANVTSVPKAMEVRSPLNVMTLGLLGDTKTIRPRLDPGIGPVPGVLPSPDVPYVTPFMRGTVRPFVGDVAETLFGKGRLDIPLPYIPFLTRPGQTISPTPRQVAESFVPTTGYEIAAETLPGVGMIPGTASAARNIARGGTRAVAGAVERAAASGLRPSLGDLRFAPEPEAAGLGEAYRARGPKTPALRGPTRGERIRAARLEERVAEGRGSAYDTARVLGRGSEEYRAAYSTPAPPPSMSADEAIEFRKVFEQSRAAGNREMQGYYTAIEAAARMREGKTAGDALDEIAALLGDTSPPKNTFDKGYREGLRDAHTELARQVENLPARGQEDLFGTEVYTSPRGENAPLERQAGLGIGAGERPVEDLPMFKAEETGGAKIPGGKPAPPIVGEQRIVGAGGRVGGKGRQRLTTAEVLNVADDEVLVRMPNGSQQIIRTVDWQRYDLASRPSQPLARTVDIDTRLAEGRQQLEAMGASPSPAAGPTTPAGTAAVRQAPPGRSPAGSEPVSAQGSPSGATPPPSAPAPPAPPPPPIPPSGGAATIPPAARGSQFVGALRPFRDVLGEVVTSENRVVRALVGKTGINPSILENTGAGKALTAYLRQRVASEELTQTAVSAALDTHAQRFTGRMGGILPIDRQGLMTVQRGGVKGKAPWQDVFSTPDKFNLSAAQRAYVGDYRAVVNQVEDLRVENGLQPRSKTGPDGWGYVPRQVKGIRGVELRRPSSPGLQRIYDDAVEGYAKGIRYDADPRATLELHVRNAYREIAEKQLSDALEPLSRRPTQLIPGQVRTNLRQAAADVRAAEKAARQRIQATAQAGGKAPMPSTFAKKVAAEPDVQAARDRLRKAVSANSRALQSARRAEVAPGALFGKTEDTIPVGQWRNRFFTREEADRINEVIGRFQRKGEVNKAGALTRGLEVLGNYTRFLASVGDFAEPFIQGLPVLAQDPKAWGMSALRHYYAFLDPTSQARFIRSHLDTFQEMSRHGVPIGDPEFFAAIKEGGGLSAGKLVGPARPLAQKIGQHTFGRFGASYNMGLGSSRAYLWEASRMAPEAKAQWIKNLTGGLDSRALGVGPDQRAAESTWMAFSPRLMRSTFALIGDAARPTTPQGRAAFRSLVQLAAGATGVYIATGVALGKSQQEIKDGLNPLNGKRFLAHEINGDWIGVGGQIRAVVQLIGKAIANPEGLTSTNSFDNPLIAFYMSRGAPAYNIVGGTLEAASGGKFNVLPFDNIDSLPDLAKHIGTSALPFALQGVLEGQNWQTTLAGLFGARTSAQTLSERVAESSAAAIERALEAGAFPPEIAASLKGKDYVDLTSRERLALKNFAQETGDTRLLKDLDDRERDLREKGSIFQVKRDEVAAYWKEKSPQLDTLYNSLLNGGAPAPDIREELKRIRDDASDFYADPDYRRAIEDLPENDIYKVLDQWNSIPDKIAAKNGGVVNWDMVDEVRKAFLSELASADRNLANRLAFNLQDQPDPNEHKLIQLYDKAQPIVSAYYEVDAKQRELYRMQNPKVDALLWMLGYVSTVRSTEAARLAQQMTTGREIKLVR